MAEYQVVIVSPQGETWDVTERVSTLTWSGSIKRVSRSVEAVMATPNDGSLPELPCELGNELRLWAGARPPRRPYGPSAETSGFRWPPWRPPGRR